MDQEVIRLLANSEQVQPEKASTVEISSEGREIVIVSDLHLSQGKSSMGTFGGTENFFSDEAFDRFLSHVNTKLMAKGKKGLLVINGDFIDFLRVVSVPRGEQEFREWEEMLQSVGINDKSLDFLKNSVSDKERDLGLKTDDYKSVWKLSNAVRGHSALFDALARWINEEHSLLILKGNHDLEWYWVAVRNYLRLALANRLQAMKGTGVIVDCLNTVIRHCSFVDSACLIDKEIYVEHGHRYDRFTKVVGRPTFGDHESELNIPFGSFFNRYLINKLELVYPFLDNVRPSANILHMLMRERFFLGLKVLFYYLPFAVKMIPKQYVRYMLKPILGYILAIGLPLLLALVLWGGRLVSLIFPDASASHPVNGLWGSVVDLGIGFAKDSAVLFLSYLFSRFVSYVQLEEVAYLMEPARRKLEENPEYRLVTMGHTHNPEQYQRNGRWYINSGTWIPVVESSTSALREDKTYAVIYLERDSAGKLLIQPLQRWNDDAGRIEALNIIDRK